MKTISILLLLIFLTSCTWNYKNGDIQKIINAQEVQELEKELSELEQEKAKETLEKIKLENEIASEVLDNFLKSDNFDIKAEIARTKEKYNDNLGPILEYEHEKIEEEIDEETNTGSTLTGTTQTGSLLNTNTGTITEENKENIYSGEVIIKDETNNIDSEKIEEQKDNIEIENKFTTQTKTGKSGIYTMYIGITDTCSGGLEMQDLEKNKKWLFENTCDKKIYDFELAIGGIKVFYNNAKGLQENEFVTLK